MICGFGEESDRVVSKPNGGYRSITLILIGGLVIGGLAAWNEEYISWNCIGLVEDKPYTCTLLVFF